ncbi:MAG: hypothetical protein M1819_005482 [Sarea resinae]|nr:MAG: hypothetical protein M1819_005482 [Sarea resinae]
MSSLIRLALAFLLAAALVGASNSTASSNATVPAASTFILKGTGDGNLTFAVNVADNSEDLYFHLSASTGNQWVAIGAGSHMKNSLIFVVYTSKSGKNITLSSRIATGHSEPVYNSSIQVDVLAGSGIENGSYVVNARCSNCRTWKNGALNLTSKVQPWIYAVGPGERLRSDSMTAGLRRHGDYGSFTMDMVQATGNPGVPIDTMSMSGAAARGGKHSMSDIAVIFHVFFMVLAFVLILPFGVVISRVFNSIRWHMVNQIVGALFVLVGACIGFYMSPQYNRSKHFNSAHQVLGLLAFIAVIVQIVIGCVGRRIYKKTQQKHPYLGLSHIWNGRILIVVGIANGAVGFVFAGTTWRILPYLLVTAFIIFVFASLLFLKRMRGKREIKASEPGKEQGVPGYMAPPLPYESNVHLTTFAAPPSYGRIQTGPRSVHLAPGRAYGPGPNPRFGSRTNITGPEGPIPF